jgi:S1-C subfamily serine protease
MKWLPLTVVCAAGVAISSASALSQGNAASDRLPAIATLQKLSFTPSSSPSPNEADATIVREALESFRVFRDGAQEVAGWQWNEPPRTRGPEGIKVYKTAVGAVVYLRCSSPGADGTIRTMSGTGAILAPDDVILTAWHVVKAAHESGQPILVYLKPSGGVTPADTLAYRADVVFRNPLKDLALLRFRQAPPWQLAKLKFARITDVLVGQNVHIIGHPRGDTWSYSTGVISQIRPNYKANLSGESGADVSPFEANSLQLQAAVSPGNSGGPVLNDDADIVGIVIFVRDKTQNVDYAVAIDEISAFLSRYDKQVSEPPSPPKPVFRKQSSTAPLPGGGRAIKTEYAGLTTYTIVSADGTVKGVIADTGNGDVIEASQPSSNSGFKRWVARFANGHVAEGLGDSGKPVQFMNRK